MFPELASGPYKIHSLTSNGTFELVMPATRSPSNSPPYDPPTYTIALGRDNSLRWGPPPGSKELGFALSYNFPLEATIVGKMQAAIRKWHRDQPDEPLQP